jgi:hypothetical protein
LFGGLLARIAEYLLNGSPREVKFHIAAIDASADVSNGIVHSRSRTMVLLPRFGWGRQKHAGPVSEGGGSGGNISGRQHGHGRQQDGVDNSELQREVATDAGVNLRRRQRKQQNVAKIEVIVW